MINVLLDENNSILEKTVSYFDRILADIEQWRDHD